MPLLLDSSRPASHFGRYDIAMAEPLAVITHKDGVTKVEQNNTTKTTNIDPFSLIGQLQSELLVDTPSVYLNATEKFELECPLIYLGVEQDSAEGGAPTVGSTAGHPLVMGDVDDSWKARFCDIVDAMLTTLQSEIHPTPCGPSGPPVQAPQYGSQQSDLAALKADIPTQYSQTVYVQP